MLMILTTQQFINNSNKVHNHMYDYALVDYVQSNIPVKITCRKHGDFMQRPNNHINGQGCPLCGLSRSVMSTEQFIIDCNNKWKNIYTYSKTSYINSKTKIIITCMIHGDFTKRPDRHLAGSGCLKCKKDNKKLEQHTKIKEQYKYSTNDFINIANSKHNNSYDYTKTVYINEQSKVIITCRLHGDFIKRPHNHIAGQGCPHCSANRINMTSEEFYSLASMKHSNKYDYTETEYVHTGSIVDIRCHEHGIFSIRANNHINGQGCPNCRKSSVSIQEQQLRAYINTILNIQTIDNSKNIIYPHEIDIYCPITRLAIEYNGLYWHSDEKKSSTYHLDKTNKCKEKGIRLIHIFEDEWINKQQIVKSRLSNIFNKTSSIVYARKCIIRNVNTIDTKKFLLENHIQGYAPSRYNVGLYYKNELVSLMTFSNLRAVVGSKHVDGSFELLRFCNKLDTSVIGGASKLLKHFTRSYQPIEIVSYSDKRWSVGNMYEQLGFVHVHDSQPNYFYVCRGIRKHRYGFRKDLLVSAGYDPEMTEQEIMKARGIHRIYDCGASKWLLTLLN